MRAKKSLSQNFLIDQNIVRKIVAAADLQEGETVLEIGPGKGAITKVIQEHPVKWIGVELDPELAGLTDAIEGDILDYQITEEVKIVANIPYQITSPILGKFVPQHDKVKSLVLMMQDDVAERCVGKTRSSLSVFLEFYSDVEYLFKVSPNCLRPKPKIDSAVVRITPKPPPEGIDPEKFFKMVRSAFQQRRKMLRSTIVGCNSTKRPEELQFDDWLKLLSESVEK